MCVAMCGSIHVHVHVCTCVSINIYTEIDIMCMYILRSVKLHALFLPVST